MKSHNEKKMQRRISLICSVFFVAYSFTFIAIHQAPLLEMFYDKVATGKLIYNRYVSATVITAILAILALRIQKTAKFQREWVALSFLPSSMILAFITDIDRQLLSGSKTYTTWIIIFAITILLLILASYILRRVLVEKIRNYKTDEKRIVCSNILILAILFCITGTLSGNDENLRNEASAYHHYKHGNLDAALSVAKKSLTASHELTAARTFYMAQQGCLGERLFTYPQYYGAEGLLPANQAITVLQADTIICSIETMRNSNEKALDYLRRAAEKDSTTTIAVEYLLCALLLEKKIKEFADILPKYYNTKNENLPRHYKEALTLYSDINNDFPLPFKDEKMESEYAAMKKMESEINQRHIRNNHIRRNFGKTYWWYYNYADMQHQLP